MATRTGACACGAVTYEAEVADEYGACHCDTCRRWAGGVLMAIRGDGVRFAAPENILRWRSSEWAERGSCRICGSALFYRLLEKDLHLLNVGTLDDQSGLSFTQEVFIDEKPAHFAFAGEREAMTGPELMMKLGGGDAG